MSWRIAESLEVLRKQLNIAFPNRSKISDGGIGDANHASRSSDHNPWLKDAHGVGVVTARDFTHDPANGLDCSKLAEWLIESRDPRIKYIIWNHRILSSKNSPWQWRPYSGVNSHTHHLHLSVNAEPKYYDNPARWDLDIAVTQSKPVVTAKNLKGEEIELEISPEPNIQTEKSHQVEPEQSSQTQTIAPEVNIKDSDVKNVDATPVTVVPSNAPPVEIPKERPSTFVKIGAIFTAITGFGINLASFVQSKLESLPLEHITYILLGVGLIALAIWAYDRSAQRANKLNEKRIDAASSTDKYSVNFTKK